jgi:hypothetical protein
MSQLSAVGRGRVTEGPKNEKNWVKGSRSEGTSEREEGERGTRMSGKRRKRRKRKRRSGWSKQAEHTSYSTLQAPNQTWVWRTNV